MAEQQAHMLAEQRYGQTGGWEYARRIEGPAYAYDYGRRVPWGTRECPSYGWGGRREFGGRFGGEGFGRERHHHHRGLVGRLVEAGRGGPEGGFGGGYGPEYPPPGPQGGYYGEGEYYGGPPRNGGW